MEARWRQERLSRWHGFCAQELEGGRRVYHRVRGGVAPPEPGGHPLGTMAHLARVSEAWQCIWVSPGVGGGRGRGWLAFSAHRWVAGSAAGRAHGLLPGRGVRRSAASGVAAARSRAAAQRGSPPHRAVADGVQALGGTTGLPRTLECFGSGQSRGGRIGGPLWAGVR